MKVVSFRPSPRPLQDAEGRVQGGPTEVAAPGHVATTESAHPDGVHTPQTVALVVVLPDVVADWHLEVIGALVRALGMFMLTERAWRTDFRAASTVPFSVEALRQFPSEP
ncbi:unnamed protein product [Polarella glacialis]|uniref:Uncharacterized protein n=1 Tax=Polarella glacialis TaxID=89957 RepID=A0A813HYH5_POLGL|nr:unnamed protein product [Polarella glacialis]